MIIIIVYIFILCYYPLSQIWITSLLSSSLGLYSLGCKAAGTFGARTSEKIVLGFGVFRAARKNLSNLESPAVVVTEIVIEPIVYVEQSFGKFVCKLGTV